MPITIPNNLPVASMLSEEGIFAMFYDRAQRQDIRPLKIAILNLMPEKEQTEFQILRLLGNSPLQVDIVLLYMESRVSSHTPMDHMVNFYKTFDEIKKQKFDGLIITGAPIEHLAFDEVSYWKEMTEIFDWTKTNVTSTMHICWGAQAGLYHHFGINKYPLPEKKFGVYPHDILKNDNLIRGFDDYFYCPVSRHTEIRAADVLSNSDLELLASSDEAGACIIKADNDIYITGHLEYARYTLDSEYKRDLSKNLPIKMPVNYYPNNDPDATPLVTWRSYSNLLFINWLNYYVYQITPYEL